MPVRSTKLPALAPEIEDIVTSSRLKLWTASEKVNFVFKPVSLTKFKLSLAGLNVFDAFTILTVTVGATKSNEISFSSAEEVFVFEVLKFPTASKKAPGRTSKFNVPVCVGVYETVSFLLSALKLVDAFPAEISAANVLSTEFTSNLIFVVSRLATASVSSIVNVALESAAFIFVSEVEIFPNT